MAGVGREWRAIEGYEDRYEISSFGEVRSLRYKQGSKPRLLIASPDSHGYPLVKLYDGTGLRGKLRIGVHRLVAAAFIGPKPDGLEINHIDGDPANNAASNLEYVTRAENLRHAERLGLKRSPKSQPRKNGRWCRAEERGVAPLPG